MFLNKVVRNNHSIKSNMTKNLDDFVFFSKKDKYLISDK